MIAISLPAALFAVFAVNGVTFILFGIDKLRAEAGEWRIAESTLLGLSLFGGSGGALLARHLFRHKTRKEPFSSQLHTIAVIQALIAAALVGALI